MLHWRALGVTMLALIGLPSATQAEESAKPSSAKPSSVKNVAGTKPNILFIAIDDLNHWVGHLGRNKQVKTPNLDRLAKMGTTFTRAYCAAPVCNPSRAALMSGLLPSTTGVYENNTD